MSTGALLNFYRSKRWEKVRHLYLTSKCFICERCGREATVVHHRSYLSEADLNDLEKCLGFDNLEALCVKCHAIEHHGTSATRDGISFDADGNVIVTATDA